MYLHLFKKLSILLFFLRAGKSRSYTSASKPSWKKSRRVTMHESKIKRLLQRHRSVISHGMRKANYETALCKNVCITLAVGFQSGSCYCWGALQHFVEKQNKFKKKKVLKSMACILHDTYDGDAPGYRPVTAHVMTSTNGRELFCSSLKCEDTGSSLPNCNFKHQNWNQTRILHP